MPLAADQQRKAYDRMPMLAVRMLGPVEVRTGAVEVEIGSASQRAILAALALAGGRIVSAENLFEAVWGEDPPPSAASSLQAYISRLRKSLGSGAIAGSGGGYRLVDAATDIDAFERSAAADRLDDIDAALDLWRGTPFGDLTDHEPFRSERLRLEELHRSIEERRVELVSVHNPEQAAADLAALCRREPLRERRWELLARCLAATGRQAEALRALDAGRDALAEVGLDPSPSLGDLASELASMPRRRPGGAVPDRSNPLVGRNRELDELSRLLESHRVVTLVGPGGVGKTSLAQVVATDTEGFGGTINWCELAPHGDASALVPAVARAVNAPVIGEVESALVRHLEGRRMLLVLDNCEHLIAEAARVTEIMVNRCPGLRVLATSRETLAIPAERVMTVEPLDHASAAVDLFVARAVAAGAPPQSLDRSTVATICGLLDGLPLAVEMAAARARHLGPAELCERLRDSLGVLASPSRTAASRHRTLASVVEWSIGLLEPDEALTLRRATVFSGGFDLTAAEAVLGTEPVSSAEVLGLLAGLVDRSLLAVHHESDGTRYSMLETIRWVVQVADDESGHATVRRRHSQHFADLAESVALHTYGPDEASWAARASRDLPNLQAAVFNSLRHGDIEPALRICAGLHRFAYQRLRADVAAWSARLFPEVEGTGHTCLPQVAASAAVAAIQAGRLEEARDWCHRGRRAAPDADLMAIVELECDIATYEGRFQEAVDRAVEMRKMAIAAGSTGQEAMAGINMALALAYLGDTDRALETVEDLRELVHRTGSDTVSAWHHYVEGEILLDSRPDRAVQLLDRAVALARRTGATFPEGVAGVSAASLRARHGDPSTSRARFSETIRRWHAIGDWVHQWVTLRNLAVLLDRVGDAEGAAMILGAVDGRCQPPHGDEASRIRDIETALRERLGDGTYERLRAEGARLEDREVVDVALSRLAAPTGVTTLLMTDMVGSTRLIEAIGDAAWLDLVEWHDRTLQSQFTLHRGSIVDRAGDGYLVMFDAPGDAIACATAIRRTLLTHRKETGFAPQLRVAVHEGTVVFEEGAPRGRDVHVTARIVDAAEPDEILISGSLADALAIVGAGRRTFEAKGIEGRLEVVSLSVA
jgi:predicted ATPase/DNA-binding SARP family transcriptional activator/class 3 adenylate cyclase